MITKPGMIRFGLLASLVMVLIFFASCRKLMPDGPANDETLEGPLEGLSNEERARHLSGDIAFSDIFTIAEGLGPVFVSNQCASCHAADGKGAPFLNLVRFGQSDSTGNKYLGSGGPQLQHRAIPGYGKEVLPQGAPSTVLIAPAVTGLGFLDAVSDADLLLLSDPLDTDGDGISGRPHWNHVPTYVTPRTNAIVENGRYITRFGKKGATYDLLQQTANAYNQDMGIISAFESVDTYSSFPEDPEVDNTTIADLVFYLRTLKAPVQRQRDDENVIRGKEIFSLISCSSCHVPELRTGYSPIRALSEKIFHPYTDLLLHDMGPELNDGYTEGFALDSEWKTAALWGLGLSKESQGGAYFLMHDGRASGIEQAIMLHGGEAENSRNLYKALSGNEKQRLIEFLESL